MWSSVDGSTWIQVNNNPDWSNRSGHTSVVFDPDRNGDRIWVIGGGGRSAEVGKSVYSSTDGQTWANDKDFPDTVYRARIVKYNDRLWSIGGEINQTKGFLEQCRSSCQLDSRKHTARSN